MAMPLYEYQCDTCGLFSALGKISSSSSPVVCRTCGSLSDRIISAPHLAILGKPQRAAHERNEKSAHAPRSTRRSSCGCSGAHTCNKSNTGKTATNPGGLQMQTKRNARPWMLGH
jgi:putative FmdB family regulatory protein